MLRKSIKQQRPNAVMRSRTLRREATESEKLFWNWVRDRKIGFKFRRQVAIGPYTVDFYCAEARLVVEVDGEVHQLTVGRDQVRDKYLGDLGLQILRVETLAFYDRNHPQFLDWLKLVISTCEEQTGRKGIWPV